MLNTFFVLINRYNKRELVTPPDNGCILANTIRNSILQLKAQIEKETDLVVSERAVSIHELIGAYEEERLVEAFGCSTPSFIAPIKRVVYKNAVMEIDNAFQGQYFTYLN